MKTMNREDMIWVYCPKCAEIEIDYEKNEECSFCNTKIAHPDKSDDEINNMTIDEFNKWKHNLTENTIKKNPLFNVESYSRRLRVYEKTKQPEDLPSRPYDRESRLSDVSNPKIMPSPVRCPKCNSTQIQAVNKKWSLLTGFLTNKTQRFCLNCKHKF